MGQVVEGRRRVHSSGMTVATPQVRWRYVFAGLAAGEIIATVLLLLPMLGLTALRVAPVGAAPHPGLLLQWPFAFDGVWSVFTDVTLLALLAAAGAPVIARVVGAVAQRRVSVRRTAFILLVTGGVPLAWSHGVVPGPLLSYLAAAAAIRGWAIDREERPLRRRTWIVIAAVAVALVASACAYAALHPLRISGAGGPGPVLVVANNSPFEARLESVRPQFPGGGPQFPFGFRSVSACLAPRATTAVPLVQLHCDRGTSGLANVTEVVVRFRVLGREEQQRLALGSPLTLRCP
jgi:hypothetical protein